MNEFETYPIFNDIVRERYSCRSYTPEPVSRESVLSIMEAARLAPSACNRQPWRFIVAEAGTPLHGSVLKAYDRDWVKDVQVFIIACGVHTEGWKRGDGKDHTDIDVAIAIEHICLAATSLGLCSCWICNFDKDGMSKYLKLSPEVEPIAIIPIGHCQPTAKVPNKIRKSMDEILTWGEF